MRKLGRTILQLIGLPCHLRCHQMDDFGPAKNLMTMCFTYYHIGKARGRGRGGGRTWGLKTWHLVTRHRVRISSLLAQSCEASRKQENLRLGRDAQGVRFLKQEERLWSISRVMRLPIRGRKEATQRLGDERIRSFGGKCHGRLSNCWM